MLIKYLHYTKTDSQSENSSDSLESNSENYPSISIETKRMLPELIKQMEGDFSRKWKSVSDGIIINDIKGFATEVLDLCEKSQYSPVQAWAQKLLKHASMYDTEGINVTLRKFPEQIAVMKEHL